MTSILIRIALMLACTAAFVGTVTRTWDHLAYRNMVLESVQEELIAATSAAARRTADFLEVATDAADGLAAGLSHSRPPEREMLQALREMIGANHSFYGGTIAFRPYGWSGERRLYAPYYARRVEEGLVFLQIEEEYDYTEWGWYEAAMRDGPRWSEPYFDDSVGDILMTTYSAVFHEPGPDAGVPTPGGVVTVDLSMDAIAEIVRSLDLGSTGFAALVSSDGKFLYHPEVELVLSGKTVEEIAATTGDPGLAALVELLGQGRRGFAEYVSAATGRPSWLVYEPVGETGWSLVSVYAKDDVAIDSSTLRQQLIGIVGWVLALVLAVIALALNMVRVKRRPVWIGSALASLILTVAIGVTWVLALDYDSETTNRANVVNDLTGLANYLARIRQEAEDMLLDPPTPVPTGIFIDSAGFSLLGEFAVKGYVWQKYGHAAHAGVSRGFIVAEAAAFTVGEPQLTTLEECDVLRWPFEATLRTHLDFGKYPL